MVSTTDLPARLRRSTADLHLDTEHIVGLPGSVHSRVDYAALLVRLYGFHSAVERQLESPEWASGWANLRVDLAAHRRTHLLLQDIANLGQLPPAGLTDDAAADSPHPTSFAQALGCLYVVEGSALGGRFLGPEIRSAVPGLPTAFFDSDGRGHPHPWREVKSALRRFENRGGDLDDVEVGARATFTAFGQQVASSLWSAVA